MIKTRLTNQPQHPAAVRQKICLICNDSRFPSEYSTKHPFLQLPDIPDVHLSEFKYKLRTCSLQLGGINQWHHQHVTKYTGWKLAGLITTAVAQTQQKITYDHRNMLYIINITLLMLHICQSPGQLFQKDLYLCKPWLKWFDFTGENVGRKNGLLDQIGLLSLLTVLWIISFENHTHS